MNTNELDAIRRRIDSATDGPWEVSGQRVVRRHPDFPGPGGAKVVEPILSDAGESAANLALAAHAREDVPALLAEVEQLRADRDRLAATLDRVREALAGHPRCEKHAGDDPITCGWKRAVLDVQGAIEGTDS